METNVRNTALQQEMFSLIEEYRQSNQTQQEFCEKKGISLFKFKYWLKKYSKESATSQSFIPLQIKDNNTTNAYRIDLPNGIIIHLNGSEGLKLISEIISHVCGK